MILFLLKNNVELLQQIRKTCRMFHFKKYFFDDIPKHSFNY